MHAHKRRLWALGVAIVAIAALLFVAAGRFEVRARMNEVVETVRDAGPVPFFTAMTLLPTVGFPLSPFTLAAGPVFGPTMGVGWVVLCGIGAITLNVALTYWLAARALRPVAEWAVRRLGYRLPAVQPHAAWLAIIILRTVPVTPFCVQSILLGLARVPFGPYMLVSIVVPSAYATALILLGDSLMRGDRWAIAGAVALFVAVGVILHVMRKRFGKAAASLRVTHDVEND
ncbi:MAG: TVP38/TMEM64 family protein [Opitutaceae bacterium]